jgi:hypothetical protein
MGSSLDTLAAEKSSGYFSDSRSAELVTFDYKGSGE